MASAYLPGENSIRDIKDKDLLERAVKAAQDGKVLARVTYDPKAKNQLKGQPKKEGTEHEIMTETKAKGLKAMGHDVLVYDLEDIKSQIRKLDGWVNPLQYLLDMQADPGKLVGDDEVPDEDTIWL